MFKLLKILLFNIALNLLVRRDLKIFDPCVAVGAMAIGYVVETAFVVAVFSQALPDLGVVKRTLCERFELFEIVVAPDAFVASVVLGAGGSFFYYYVTGVIDYIVWRIGHLGVEGCRLDWDFVV